MVSNPAEKPGIPAVLPQASPLPAAQPTIERLSRYRRALKVALRDGATQIFSHQLAKLTGATAAQVRRDLMVVRVAGSPRYGYDIAALTEAITAYLLGGREGRRAVLVGLGRLGRAMLSYFVSRRPGLSIVAAFDTDPSKVGRVVEGCRCFPLEELAMRMAGLGTAVAIIAVPAKAAQSVADLLVCAGVTGIANFAPVSLDVPPDVFVENVDLTMSLEKVAYYAHRPAKAAGG
ncbi:MAG: redox-sensing transcriptional repressor Rex [Polyangiaceae bacterium]|nr:redox-sensing transcriptional repressor Rex [Polyangiaceae bacterium]